MAEIVRYSFMCYGCNFGYYAGSNSLSFQKWIRYDRNWMPIGSYSEEVFLRMLKMKELW